MKGKFTFENHFSVDTFYKWKVNNQELIPQWMPIMCGKFTNKNQILSGYNQDLKTLQLQKYTIMVLFHIYIALYTGLNCTGLRHYKKFQKSCEKNL